MNNNENSSVIQDMSIERDTSDIKEQELCNDVATCNRCGFSGHADKFEACLSVWHDLRCPMCGTTDINQSNGLMVYLPEYTKKGLEDKEKMIRNESMQGDNV